MPEVFDREAERFATIAKARDVERAYPGSVCRVGPRNYLT